MISLRSLLLPFALMLAMPAYAADVPEKLTYETLIEPEDTASVSRKDALAAYQQDSSDIALAQAVAALLQLQEADDAWDLIEEHGPSASKIYFKTRLDTINANLGLSGSLGKLKWARRLRAHCSARLEQVPDDENALECLIKFHHRAPSVAGGEKETSAALLETLGGINAPRANLIEAELVFKDDPERARVLVDQAMDHSDIYGTGLLEAAMVYGYFKEWDKAIAVLGRIPADSEISGMRHYQLGKLSAEQGEKLDLGEEALLTFLSGQTRYLGVNFRGPAHWRLGQIFVHQERYDLAKQAFSNALRHNPRLKPAKRDLKRLKSLMENQG